MPVIEVKGRQSADPEDERTDQPWTQANPLGWDIGTLVFWRGSWYLSFDFKKNIVFTTPSDLARYV
jgi:hypothetical protein